MPYFTASDIPDMDDMRQTSFELCVSLNDVDGMKRLFAEGVELNANCAEYGNGNTLVLVAEAGATEAVSYLLSVGVAHDPAAIGAAAARGHTEIVELLLDAGIKPNSDSLIGLDGEEMIERLVSAGASLNAPSSHGLWFALHNAVVEDKISIVDTLLRAGADPNVATTDGSTPLMLAVRGGNLAIVNLLIHHGANITLKNDDHLAALDIAKESNWPDVVDLLTQTNNRQ